MWLDRPADNNEFVKQIEPERGAERNGEGSEQPPDAMRGKVAPEGAQVVWHGSPPDREPQTFKGLQVLFDSLFRGLHAWGSGTAGCGLHEHGLFGDDLRLSDKGTAQRGIAREVVADGDRIESTHGKAQPQR